MKCKRMTPYEGEAFTSLKQKIPGRLQIIKTDDRLPVPHPMKGAVMISSSPQKCWMSLCWPYVQLLRKVICIHHHPPASVPQGHLLSSRLEGVESIIRRRFWRALSLLCSGTQVELDTDSHAQFLIGLQVEGGKEVSLRDWNFQCEQGCSGSAGRHRTQWWNGQVEKTRFETVGLLGTQGGYFWQMWDAGRLVSARKWEKSSNIITQNKAHWSPLHTVLIALKHWYFPAVIFNECWKSVPVQK